MKRQRLEFKKYYENIGKNFVADSWIATHSPINTAKLHALGLVQFYWVGCENELLGLFSAISDWSERETWIMLHDQGDIGIINKLKEIMNIRNIPDDYSKLIQQALQAYDICRINRNNLTHFTIVAGKENIDGDSLRLHRTSRKAGSMFGTEMEDDLWNIRVVANDIRKLRKQLIGLWMYEFRRKKENSTAITPKEMRLPRNISKNHIKSGNSKKIK